MHRFAKYSLVFVLAAYVFPVPALAYQNQFTPVYVHLVISAAGLAVAMILLVEALRIRKIFLGGAIAEKIHFVILAIVCLAASAVAKWAMNFVGDLTFEQTELASEMLVLVAMALLAAYFFSVGSAMQTYLKTMQASIAGSHDTTSDALTEDSEADTRG